MKRFDSALFLARPCLLFLLAPILMPPGRCAAVPALKNSVILIVRHAEKPDSGAGLAPAGFERAKAYVNYFKHFEIDSQPLHLDHIFATADSKNSRRPRETMTPLAAALRLPLDSRFKDKNFQALAGNIRSHQYGHGILICWHHGEIPELINALGADANQLLPRGKWPAGEFGWIIELRYNDQGKIIPAQCHRINEHLMPDDNVQSHE